MEGPYDFERYSKTGPWPCSEIIEGITEILERGNYTLVVDGDYGAVPKWYTGVQIGKWDKPYVRTEITNEQVREQFNKVIAQTQDADQVAKLEVCREYFTNPEFKERLQEYVFARTQNDRSNQTRKA